MILDNVGMLAVSSNRSKIYLQQMSKHRLIPSWVLYLEDDTAETPEAQAIARSTQKRRTAKADGDSFDLSMSMPELLESYEIPYKLIPTIDPNSRKAVDAVSECRQSVLVYSGPGGRILRKEILSTGKRFLHIHPGYLPDYRGSTTLYYSLLKEGTCGATAFIMDRQIDGGPIVRRRYFPAPADRTTIDLYYDPLIRSQLLVEVLRDYARTGEISGEHQDPNEGETYFIIHPVLKHLAMLGR